MLVVEQGPADFKYKLCDFGESVIWHSSLDYIEHELVSTAAWSAPEVLRAPRRYSVSSDLYGVALVTFEMMVRRPFWEISEVDEATQQPRCFDELALQGWRPACTNLEYVTPTAVLRGWSYDYLDRGSVGEFVESLKSWEIDPERAIPPGGLELAMYPPVNSSLEVELGGLASLSSRLSSIPITLRS